MITLEDGVKLVWKTFDDMVGGEIYVKKIPSMKVTDIALSVHPESKREIIGIRPGEKLHEQMIGAEDAQYTYDYGTYYKVLPAINQWSDDPIRVNKGKKVSPDFTYCSNTNKDWMTVETLQNWININKGKIGKI